MDQTFPVAIHDDAKKPVAITGARVCLVEKSALGTETHPYSSLKGTHSDAGGGYYDDGKKIALTEGDWILIVTLKGKSPVVQPLKVTKGSDGSFVVTPSPARVATVTFGSTYRMVAGKKVKETRFTVTMYPAAELVSIGGVDYNRPDVSGGWQFHTYGFHRAELLRRAGKIHFGTIVTVFSTAKIQRITRVWGPKGWVTIEVVKLGDPAARTLPAPHETYSPGDDTKTTNISIVDFYKYISDVGKREPKSVREMAIFSHSYPGGPILYNSGDRNSGSDQRDAKDYDARSKDFKDVNASKFGYDKLTDALASDSKLTIWGCSATTHIKASARTFLSRLNRPPDEFTLVTSTLEDNHTGIGVYGNIEENTSELRFRYRMDRSFRSDTYAAEAAKALKIEVRAGCPGTGSAPNKDAGLEMLVVEGGYKPVFDYFHKRFGPQFAETKEKGDSGYCDYRALQSRAPVPRPPFSTQYYRLQRQLKKTRWADVGARLTFWRVRTWIDHPTGDVRVTVRPESHLMPGKKGHLLILLDADDTLSEAVYVQEDEKIWRVLRDSDKNWTILGPLVLAH